jgi:hypothetical protein
MSKERKLLEKVAVQLLVFDLKKASDLVDEIQELLAQPDEEPVSDEELKNLYDRHAFAMESDEYMWGFRDAEKAHGIIGGEEE